MIIMPRSKAPHSGKYSDDSSVNASVLARRKLRARGLPHANRGIMPSVERFSGLMVVRVTPADLVDATILCSLTNRCNRCCPTEARSVSKYFPTICGICISKQPGRAVGRQQFVRSSRPRGEFVGMFFLLFSPLSFTFRCFS